MKENNINIQDYRMSPFKEFLKNLGNSGAILSFVLLSLLLGGAVYLYCYTPYAENLDLIGTLVGLASLVPVLGYFHINFRKQWENGLDKYLTARFQYQGNTRLEILAIRLQGTTDLRAQAQSISKVFLKSGNTFNLKPVLRSDSQRVCIDTQLTVNEGKPFLLYEVSLDLIQDIVDNSETTLAPAANEHIDVLKNDSQAYLSLSPNFNLDESLTIKTQATHS